MNGTYFVSNRVSFEKEIRDEKRRNDGWCRR